MIVCEGLCVRQGDFTLGPIDLSLDQRYHVLMGPSGSGKTTFIEALQVYGQLMKEHYILMGVM